MSPADKAAGALLIGLMAHTALFGTACRGIDTPAREAGASTLTIGYGLTSGTTDTSGISQAISNLSLDALIGFTRDGRAQGRLAERWETSADGRQLDMW